MLKRPVITEQEYEKRRHEPEFSKVEELNYEQLSQTVYASATGSFGDIFGSSGEKINIRLVSLMGKVTYLNVGKDSYVEELQALLHEEEHISGLRGHYVFIYGGRLIEKGHRLSEYQVPARSKEVLGTCYENCQTVKLHRIPYSPSLKGFAQLLLSLML
eukprot:Em0012g843a